MTRLFRTGGPERYQHQRRGLQKCISTGGKAALLFDPGTGKTAVALDYASVLALKLPAGEARVLVVCPLVAIDTWVSQAATFVSPDVGYWAEAIGGSLDQRAQTMAARGGVFPKDVPARQRKVAPRALNVHLSIAIGHRHPVGDDAPLSTSMGPDGVHGPRLVLLVTNLDTFTSRARVGSKTRADLILDAVRKFDPDLVIVDESHKIKGAMANASRLLGRVAKVVPRRLILTGTVMPHSPLDVYAQWRFLDPYVFGYTDRSGVRHPSTFSGFQDRFAVMGGWMGREILWFRNLDDMQDLMAQNAVVARKDDVLDLPPTTDVVVPVHLSPTEQKAYAEMKEQLAVLLADGTALTVNNRLVQLLRLRQITAGYTMDGALPVLLGRSKIDTITSLVTDTLAGEKRLVIFCLFSAEIAALADSIGKADPDAEIMVIQGGTPVQDRLAMRARFGSTEPARLIMVVQIKTMSLAVNELVTASHAIFASLSQQRDELIQARDRLNRLGQTRPVTFWYALAPGTVDEVILASHQDRTDLEAALLAHIHGETTT